jgi:hypothetical protein
MGLNGVTATALWYAEGTENCYEDNKHILAVAVLRQFSVPRALLIAVAVAR